MMLAPLWRLLAALCTNTAYTIVTVTCALIGGFLAWGHPILSLLVTLPCVVTEIARSFNHGQCPLPRWRATLLRRAQLRLIQE